MSNHCWNVDESGLHDYFITLKIVAEVAKQKGETTTVVAAFSAIPYRQQ